MKQTTLLLLFISLHLIFVSCRTTTHNKSKNRPKPQNNIKNNVINSKLQSVERTIANQDERISDLSFQLKQLIEVNNSLVKKVNILTKRDSEILQKVAILKKNNSTLASNLETDRKNRQLENQQLLHDIVSKTTDIVNAKTNEVKRQMSTLQTSKPVQSKLPNRLNGEYYEYKVQTGATLAAIAKAYHVRISDIKKANNLKSDFIRVGQKLYIPKK